jgi:phage gp16-like protein
MGTRTRELALIHMGKKALGMDDDTYRDFLHKTANVRSAAELSAAGLRAVIEAMRALGFRAKPSVAAPQRVRAPRERAPLVAKVRALLNAAGRDDAYADAMAKRMFGVDRFEWLLGDQLWRLVAALEIDRKRREKREASRSEGATSE